MLLHRKAIIDWFLVAAAALVGLFSLSASFAQAQPARADAYTEIGPILTAQLPTETRSAAAPAFQPRAMRIYAQAVGELQTAKAAAAEKDARRAVKPEPRFAHAEALAATAALMQRQFSRARDQATRATAIDPRDSTAWLILATADNHLARYAEATQALASVRGPEAGTWQVAYQWGRAEAGQEHAAAALEWTNRAALSAPAGFAPLHLLHASALLAAGRYAPAADELQTYLDLLAAAAPARAQLSHELDRLRAQANAIAALHPAGRQAASYNALAN